MRVADKRHEFNLWTLWIGGETGMKAANFARNSPLFYAKTRLSRKAYENTYLSGAFSHPLDPLVRNAKVP